MKILFCQACGDMIAPFRDAKEARFCDCGRHAIWWEDPNAGVVRVFDRQKEMTKAYVLGITNLFLQYPDDSMSKEEIQELLEAHQDFYLFKQLMSPIVRIRPGATSDTGWAHELP